MSFVEHREGTRNATNFCCGNLEGIDQFEYTCNIKSIKEVGDTMWTELNKL
jgi:hypothetical protein